MKRMDAVCVAGLWLTIALPEGRSEERTEGLAEEVVELEKVVVTANPFAVEKGDLVVPASELSGDGLAREATSSLGATLDGQPGVHSTYFGPGAGRPVIRGFDGDRVRILNQGTDTFDVSQTSPDHGVSVEPLFAEGIEVVRGPASLLYGNAAIGGVVNVVGKELPLRPLGEAVTGQLEARYGTVADERSAGLALQGGVGAFAWSVGVLDRESGDYEIPGFAESHYLRALEEDEDHREEESEEHEGRGVLENSAVSTEVAYMGGTWFGDRGSLGASYSLYESEYGVPGHAHHHEGEPEGEPEGDHEEEHAHEGEEEEGAVRIHLDQSRFSVRGELLELARALETLELQFGFGEYEHLELEGDEIGTRFEREGYELKLTGVHRPVGQLTGALGLHLKEDAFAAFGEEAFIPSNDASDYGLFVVERLNTDWGAWEFGGRLASVEVDPEELSLRERSFTTGTLSLGAVRRLGEGKVLAANVSRVERAPNASELFANGPHAGTRSFEIGNPDLGVERALTADLSLRQSVGRFTGEFSLFHSDFSDYVYMRFVDDESLESGYEKLDTHGLSVFQATAVDASFYGFELDVRAHLIDRPEERLHFDLLVDQTRATNESFQTNLPRIPTRRIGGRLEYEKGPWLLGVEGRYSAAASHLAPNELPTDSYVIWGADARYRVLMGEDVEMDLFLVGSNLSDEEARSHTSYLKDLAPLPGRNVEIGLRTRF